MGKEYPRLLIAGKDKKIYDVPWLEAVGMKGGEYFRLQGSELIKMHPDSELFMMPSRRPVGYDREEGRFVEIGNNPLSGKRETCYAVSAFLSPGYTVTYNASYRDYRTPKLLPLFSYAAVAFYKGSFYAAGIRTDREKRQELSGMDMELLEENVKTFRKDFPKNRLIRHLEKCAFSYCCPAAKNFFLQRYECPLPTSPACNASCIGCISYQEEDSCSVTQPRITFKPTPEEIAETALFHINNVKDPVVSFGQGCEGEPLLAGENILEAVKIIRKKTSKGMINLNTNASRTEMVRKLFDAGLDSIRVSLNSLQKEYYSKYYLPKGYAFKDVIASIKAAKKRGGFVSINYLVMPGLSDSKDEVNAFFNFLEKSGIDMIQWRNLNYDPRAYFKRLKLSIKKEDMIGMDTLIHTVNKDHPQIMHGYFNPSLGRIRRHQRGF